MQFLQRRHTVTTSKLMQPMPHANYLESSWFKKLDRITVLLGSFQKKNISSKFAPIKGHAGRHRPPDSSKSWQRSRINNTSSSSSLRTVWRTAFFSTNKNINKSCTTKDDDYLKIHGDLAIPGGAGFLLSTVSCLSNETRGSPKWIFLHYINRVKFPLFMIMEGMILHRVLDEPDGLNYTS